MSNRNGVFANPRHTRLANSCASATVDNGRTRVITRYLLSSCVFFFFWRSHVFSRRRFYTFSLVYFFWAKPSPTTVAVSRAEMKTIGTHFAAAFRLAAPSAKRSVSSNAKPAANPIDEIKPHARNGILSAVEKDGRGFPSYLILKETSPILR